MAITPVVGTDQINEAFDKVNASITELETEIENTTSGHDHDGTDSKQVDHVNLLNKGTNTHVQIDTAISDLGTHIGDASLHGEGPHDSTTGRDTTATGVDSEDHRHIAASLWDVTGARTVQQALDASVPSAHDSLTGRMTAATGPEDANCRHDAGSVWDDTQAQNVQATLDDHETNKANQATIIAEINASTELDPIEGTKVDQASDTVRGTTLLGAADGAATFAHTHTYDDEDIGSGNDYIPDVPNGGVDTDPATVHDRLTTIFHDIPCNEILNGTFSYMGYVEGATTAHVLGTPYADSTYPFGVPGWEFVSAKATNSIKVVTASIGTPLFEGYANQIIHRMWHGSHILEWNDADWSTTPAYITSYPMPLKRAGTSYSRYTLFIWYRSKSASTNTAVDVMLEYSNNVGSWSAADGVFPLGGENDTNWHLLQVSLAGLANALDVGLVRLKLDGKTTGHDIQIAKIGIFEGAFWSSDNLPTPNAWYSPRMGSTLDQMKFSTTPNTPPTPTATFEDFYTFKKTYRCVVPIDETFTGPLTLLIPPAHFVYNVKCTPSYHSVIAVPTVPPTNVPYWYFDWLDENTAHDFDTPITSVSVDVPVPTDEYPVVFEVEYWPAANTPPTWA